MARKEVTRKKRGWKRFIIYLFLILLGLLIGGFIAFSRHVENLAPPDDIPTANGIVVWTGKGGDRLKAAGALLEQQKGERLFISGINDALNEATVIDLLGIPAHKGMCCVDFDYRAEDTIDNAQETFQWIESLGYDHIILVMIHVCT